MNQWKIFMKAMGVMGKRCPIYLATIAFMSLGFAMFAVMGSLLFKGVVDAAQFGNVKDIPRIIIVNVTGGIVAILINRKCSIIYNVEAKRAHGILCKMIFEHELKLPYSYYEAHHSGEFISKLSYDLEKASSIYGSRLRRTLAPVFHVVVYLVMMLVLSWQLTLCLIAVNLLMFFINGALIEPYRKVSKNLSKTNSKITEKISNLLQGMEQARMYAAGRHTLEEFHVENKEFEKQSNKKILYSSILESCGTGFELLCRLVFLMLGIYFVQNGYTTLGSLTAIYSVYGMFFWQFLELGKYVPDLIGCLVNVQNLFDFIEEEIEPENWYAMEQKNDTEQAVAEQAQTAVNSIIEMDQVSFCYREDKPLLENYSMQVEQGESVAIVGASGCGKTTLSKLLLGFYPLKSGDIFIEGQSYRNISKKEVRSKIAYVPQEPYLFNESIRENIRLGNLHATDEEIEQAAKMAYAHDFIMELEDGYDTNVGERGNRLSGGQRQRIAIARAIIKDAPIILLDEATSALDNESERLVNEALKSMKNRKTIVLIAHRPSTIALADKRCQVG